MKGVEAPSFQGFGFGDITKGVVSRAGERAGLFDDVNHVAAGNFMKRGFMGNFQRFGQMAQSAAPFGIAALQMGGFAARPGADPGLAPGPGLGKRMLARQHARRQERLVADAARRGRNREKANAKYKRARGMPGMPENNVIDSMMNEERTAKFSKNTGKLAGLTDFASSIQESILGGSSEKDLLKATEESANETKKNNEILADNTEAVKQLVSQGVPVKFA